jgi:hypothetical protein
MDGVPSEHNAVETYGKSFSRFLAGEASDCLNLGKGIDGSVPGIHPVPDDR